MGNCWLWTIKATVLLFESWPLWIQKQMYNSTTLFIVTLLGHSSKSLWKKPQGLVGLMRIGKAFQPEEVEVLTTLKEEIRRFIHPSHLQTLPDNPCYQHQLKRMCRPLLTKALRNGKIHLKLSWQSSSANLGLKPVTLTDKYFIIWYPRSLLGSNFFMNFAVFFDIRCVSFAFSQLCCWLHT